MLALMRLEVDEIIRDMLDLLFKAACEFDENGDEASVNYLVTID